MGTALQTQFLFQSKIYFFFLYVIADFPLKQFSIVGADETENGILCSTYLLRSYPLAIVIQEIYRKDCFEEKTGNT